MQLFAFKLACHRDKSTCKKLNEFEKKHNLPLTKADKDSENKSGELCHAVHMDKPTKAYVNHHQGSKSFQKAASEAIGRVAEQHRKLSKGTKLIKEEAKAVKARILQKSHDQVKKAHQKYKRIKAAEEAEEAHKRRKIERRE